MNTLTTTPIRVLLVEDNPGDAQLIFQMLRDVWGTFDIQHVDHLEAALAQLGRAAIDVVLLDLGLPDSQGLETVERTRRHATGEPIVIVSGMDDEDVAREAVRRGAQDFLVKGRIEGRGLARVIRHAIERQRAETRLDAIVRAALDAHVLMDAAGTITGWNPQAEAVFGWPAAAVLGRPLADIIVPVAQRAKHWAGLRHFLATGAGPILNQRVELTALRKDGEEFPIELSVTAIRVGADWSFSAFLRDISERRRAEDALRLSEERHRLLFEATPAPMWVYDLASLRILAVNGAAAAQYGYSRAEFLSMTIEELRLPEDVPELRELLAAGTPPGLSHSGVWRHVTKAGAIIMVEMASHELLFEGRRAQLVVANDVTARIRAELVQTAVYRITDATQTAAGLPELLHAIHEVVGTLMPAKSFYIALYDEATDLITFPYYVDEADPEPPAPRHPGRGITEYVLRTGRPLLAKPETKLEMDYPGAVEAIGAPSVDWLGVPLMQGDRTIGVLAVQSYTAGIRYEERDKDILHFVSIQVATAIERKRAEEALRASEQRAHTLFETVNLIVLGLDPTGTVDYVNPFFLHLTGFTSAEVIGAPWFERFVPKSQAPAVRDAFLEMMGSDAHAHYQNTIVTKSGEERTIAWSNTVVRDAAGQPTGTLSIGEDMTERARLEVQLRQGQKMEAVGRPAGGIAHDFNNLLTAIFGYSDLLGDGLPADSTAHADLNEIKAAATRAAGLTRQLLAFSRQQVLQPVVLNINDVIGNLEKMLRRVLGEDIELETRVARDLGNAKVDAGQFEQVILNLAVNARDAMPTGGKLMIETANVALTGDYTEAHRPVAPGDYVMLAVSDSGIGMDETVKNRLFEPFFTTKEVGSGTGLGLATVYGIVKQSGGYIWVYSEPGQGATFKVYLPRVHAPVDEVKKTTPTGDTLGGTETILLVEDDDLLRPLARDLLVKLGYRVLDAANGAAAVALARAHRGEIHLLVSDVVMPGQSGLQFAGELAGERPQMKVLYMSGYTDEAVVRHGLLDPGTNFLQKPFTPAVLAGKVREILDAK